MTQNVSVRLSSTNSPFFQPRRLRAAGRHPAVTKNFSRVREDDLRQRRPSLQIQRSQRSLSCARNTT